MKHFPLILALCWATLGCGKSVAQDGKSPAGKNETGYWVKPAYNPNLNEAVNRQNWQNWQKLENTECGKTRKGDLPPAMSAALPFRIACETKERRSPNRLRIGSQSKELRAQSLALHSHRRFGVRRC